MPRAIKPVLLLALGLSFAQALFPTRGARAEAPDQIPNPRVANGGWVADIAEVLSDQAERQINASIDDLKRERGAEIAVVTVKNTDDYDPKEFATELFNRWGVGEAGNDNGALFLLAIESRAVEVEVGYGAEEVLTDGRTGRILDEIVVPRLRENDWEGGTTAAVTALCSALRLADVDRAADAEGGSGRNGLLMFGGGLLALAGGAVIAYRRRQWVRHCAQCKKRMRLLSEAEDDALLSADEKLEEDLGSMNHVVWRCDACDLTRAEHRKRFGVSYTDCPKCSRRTAYKQSVVIRSASTTSSGERSVTETCKRSGCDYTRTYTETIPRVTPSSSGGSGSSGSRSSSSRSSSFGGGRSGGGGAGRRF
ncbi:MAG: TPM domain-containing protein [Candidatus Eisenbacteria bacterium]|nr:TPM domain-containing protein [Candidatus Eisenbacteria bacterium]MCC7144179.1 TPM domain-containing protein [Candidatus Eisenbacteria bacterium]